MLDVFGSLQEVCRSLDAIQIELHFRLNSHVSRPLEVVDPTLGRFAIDDLLTVTRERYIDFTADLRYVNGLIEPLVDRRCAC